MTFLRRYRKLVEAKLEKLEADDIIKSHEKEKLLESVKNISVKKMIKVYG